MLKITQFILWICPFLLAAQSDPGTLVHLRKSYHEIGLLSAKINTTASELAAHRYAKRLYFSKLPNGAEPGRAFTFLEGSKPTPFEISPSDPTQHLGFTALTNTGQRIYYTLYRQDANGEIYKSQIWYHDRDFSGAWGPSKQLPRSFVDNGKNVKHPATGILLDTRSEVLFFISDNKAGKGKGDIWCTYLEKDGSFAPPLQFPYNTEEEEAAPFFDIANQDLYFSSRGHQSYGGLDVFRSHYLGGGKWTVPENVGRPINSYYDDLFFSFNEKGHHCYLSSNRPEAGCNTADPACRNFNLYQVNLKATLQIFLFDDFDKSPLYGCNVELKDMASGDILSTYLTLAENFATVGLQPGKSYQLIISKMGYMPVFEEINADEMDFFKTSLLEIRLKPLKRPVAQVFPMEVPDAKTTPANHLARLNDSEVPVLLDQEIKLAVALETSSEVDLAAAFAEMEPVWPLPSLNAEQESTRTDELTEPLPAKAAIRVEPEAGQPSNDLAAEPEDASVAQHIEPAVEAKPTEEKTFIAEQPAPNEKPALTEKSPPADQLQMVEKTPPAGKPASPEANPPRKETVPIVEHLPAKSAEKAPRPIVTDDAQKAIPTGPAGPAAEKPAYLQQITDLILGMDPNNYLPVSNMPQIVLAAHEDPVDLLFFHKKLQCQVAFDYKKEDYEPGGTATMERYLNAIDGLLKKDQHPPLGISFFRGPNGLTVLYSFKEKTAGSAAGSFTHSFYFPAQYQGILPDPAILLGAWK